ncbi:DUF202 domain-containing protein [Alphaproteobacteria bacterium KMM 3653]|uniref:DUF202 domain-containing protein n=1 Tax=Harenicola maris TaxID=2841044 RepID=A0AAP2G8U9_9RHOB|nr:DUF202 domain-containing protein [Harenicola maris]
MSTASPETENRSSDEKSERRTNWAEDRTLMANERTFASWVGMGLACVGVAVGLKAVFGAFEPLWAAKATASVFLAAAVAIYWAARAKAVATHERLTCQEAALSPTRSFTRITIGLTIGTVATGMILWAL